MTERYRAWRERNRVHDEAAALTEALFWNEWMDDSPVPGRVRMFAQFVVPAAFDDYYWSPACPDCGDEADPTCPTCEGQS